MEAATASPQETWESTTGGVVWVQVKDPRHQGGWRTQKVGGKGTKRLSISVEEREFNQELIPYENEHLDPFRNGILVRTHPKGGERGQFELTDAELIEMLQIGDDALFQEAYRSIGSEVVLRRLLKLAEKHTNMLRLQDIQGYVDDRYRSGKTSQVVKEMLEDDARYADADL